MTRFSILLAASAIVATLASTTASPLTPRGSGQIAAVKDGNNFCFFLPPSPGGNIADSEGDAVAFCTTDMSDAPGAKIFPSGFIASAHFLQTSSYVQVTGQLNIGAYSLSASDQGGQYDVASPPGAVCAGYSTFVNLVEPAEGDYCIRCCNDDSCGRGRSTAGCAILIPGDYGPGGAPSSDTTTTVATTTSAAVPTTSSSVAVITTITTSPTTTTTSPTTTSLIASSTSTSSANSTSTAASSSSASSSVAVNSSSVAVSSVTPSVSSIATVASSSHSSSPSTTASSSSTPTSDAAPSFAPATIALTVLLAFAVALL